ncbi:hypothetical protein LPJ75_006689 [Coemansia sp. RSA 2598]|nr:hypothetical protein LPJ75_006689 [Coemansia sp. RSA 2598]
MVLPRVASAPQLTLLAGSLASEAALVQVNAAAVDAVGDVDGLFPEPVATLDVLPSYVEIDSTSPLSPVVSRWRLGEAAFEKPALHPRGYAYPDVAAEQDLPPNQ